MPTESATVTVTADDGEFTVSDTFTVTVNGVNDAPARLPVHWRTVTVDEDAADLVNRSKSDVYLHRHRLSQPDVYL